MEIKIVFTMENNGQYLRRVLVMDSNDLKVNWGTDEVVVNRRPESIQNLMSRGWEIAKVSLIRNKMCGASKRPVKKKLTGAAKAPQPKSVQAGRSPEMFFPDTKEKQDAAKFARIISRIMGSAHLNRIRSRYDMDPVGLLLSYKKAENPLDYLSRPVERQRRPKILITVDYSGSCNATAVDADAIADAIAANPALEVFTLKNQNGCVREEEFVGLKNFDLIIYLGDHDIFDDGWAGNILGCGKRQLLFSNKSCRRTSPYIDRKKTINNRAVVAGVNYKEFYVAMPVIEKATAALVRSRTVCDSEHVRVCHADATAPGPRRIPTRIGIRLCHGRGRRR